MGASASLAARDACWTLLDRHVAPFHGLPVSWVPSMGSAALGTADLRDQLGV